MMPDSRTAPIIAAIIGLVGAVLAALITNWKDVPPPSSRSTPNPIPSSPHQPTEISPETFDKAREHTRKDSEPIYPPQSFPNQEYHEPIAPKPDLSPTVKKYGDLPNKNTDGIRKLPPQEVSAPNQSIGDGNFAPIQIHGSDNSVNINQ
jgi:hypothetical protein